MPKAQIFYSVDKDGTSYERLREAGIDLLPPQGAGGADFLNARVELGRDVDAAAGIIRPLDAAGMDTAPHLRLIALYSVGYDNIDIEAATGRGILVTNAPAENNWGGVAEGTMAMMLAKLKMIRERDRHIRAGGWRDARLDGTYVGARDLDGYPGLTIGLIGFGHIAQRFAEMLAPWRVTVIVHAPTRDNPAYKRLGVEWVELDDLLARADVVSVHASLTDATRNLIGARELARMKSSAILINTARGAIVDMDALTMALKEKVIAGACIDVFAEEPPDFSHPIFSLGDEVLLAPHMVAHNVGSGLELAAPYVVDALLSALSGEVPDNVVNRDAIPLWRERFGGKSLL